MTLAAKYYIDLLKGIHATEVDDGEVPDMKETALSLYTRRQQSRDCSV